MIKHHVHHQLHIPSMNFLAKRIPIIQVAKQLIDGCVVGYIVTLIFQWGFVDWCQPDHVNPELFEIVKSLDDSTKISNAVVVAILKRLDINLIDYGFPPPNAVKVHNGRHVGVDPLDILFPSLLRHGHGILGKKPVLLRNLEGLLNRRPRSTEPSCTGSKLEKLSFKKSGVGCNLHLDFEQNKSWNLKGFRTI